MVLNWKKNLNYLSLKIIYIHKKKVENSQNFNSDPSNVADVQYIYLRFKKVLFIVFLKRTGRTSEFRGARVEKH